MTLALVSGFLTVSDRKGYVTFDRVIGAITIYMMLRIVWASFYELIALSNRARRCAIGPKQFQIPIDQGKVRR